MPTKNEALDDWIPELPALDGDDEEQQAVDLDHELSSFPDDDASDPFDDAASEDLLDDAAEIDFDAVSADGEDDEQEVDIGEIEIDEIDESESSKVADGDAELGDDGFDIDEPMAASEDDGGEEGMLDASEWGLDEPLPDLDADEGDELSEGLLLDDTSLSLDDEPLPGWADVAWETKALATPLESAGELLSLAMSGNHGAAVTTRGELLVLREGAEGYASDDALQASARGEEAAQVALSRNGRTFLLTASGALFVREGQGALSRGSCGGLLSIAASEAGTLLAISADPARGLELFVSEDSAASFSARELEGPAIVVAAAPNPMLAATEGAIGIGSEAGLVVSRDGTSFELVPGCTGTVAVAFAGEGSDAPLVAAVYRETEDRTFLVRVSAEGLAEVVAELGPTEAATTDEEPEPLGRADAIAWDSARKVLWVSGDFGLIALAA